MKKLVRISSYIMLVIGVLFLLGSALVVLILPGPKEIKSIISAKTKPAPDSISPAKSSEISKIDSHKKDIRENDLNPTGSMPQETPEEMVIRILDSDETLDVCQKLKHDTFFDASSKDQNFSFNQIFSPELIDDPFASSLRYPFIKIFHDEELSGLLREVIAVKSQHQDEDKQDSIFEKYGFYARAALTAIHLTNRKKEFEDSADRAIHVGLFARIVKLRPEILNDSGFVDRCETFQLYASNSEKTVKEERGEILKLLKEWNLSPDQLGFDPESYHSFKIKGSKEGISFNLTDNSK